MVFYKFRRFYADLFAASITFGSYISIIKLLLFVAAFCAWLPLVGWIHNDSKPLGAKTLTWTIAILCSGALGLIIWLLIPIFIVGMLLFAALVGGTSLAYVKVRNTMVPEFDRVLTIDHIRNLTVSKEKRSKASKNLLLSQPTKTMFPYPSQELLIFSVINQSMNLSKMRLGAGQVQ